MPLKNSMVGELPNIKITSTADITDETIHSEATINPLGVESSPNISKGIHPNTGEDNFSANIELNNRLLTLSSRAGNQ